MLNNNIIREDISNLAENFEINEKFFGKNILITGGTGLIASYLVSYFIFLNRKHNAKIRLFVNVRKKDRLINKYGRTVLKEVIVIEKNVEDLKINDITCDNLDYIYHLASPSSPSIITSNPTSIIKANIMGTFAVLEICKHFNSKLIFSSTREVYGAFQDGKDLIFEEDMGTLQNLDLRACYPESKRMAENIIVSTAHESQISYKIARIAHVYGPGMAVKNDGRVMSDLIGNVIRNEDIVLLSDGTALRAFCYVSDAIFALLYITLSNEGNVYNVANEQEEISILDLSHKLINLSPNKNLKVLFKEEKNNIGYVSFRRVALSTKKLESLGWSPKTNLDEGLKKTILFNIKNTRV